jgi:hypothetical protein
MTLSSFYRIVVCGQSIFAHALEAALKEDAAVDVIRLHPHLPAIVERITEFRPTVVLLENSAEHSALVLALLEHDIPLVQLDVESGASRLLTGRALPLASDPDVDRLLEQIWPEKLL